MRHLPQLLLPMIAGAGLLTIAAPAFGQPQEEIVVTGKMQIPEGYEPVKKIVKIGDLNLATSEGANEMEKRVGAAVDSICASPRPTGEEEIRMSKACSVYAWASARPQMDGAVRRVRAAGR